MHLLTSIFNYMQPDCCYGKKGDKITVIALHHQVAIVEAENKKRFPVPVESLSEKAVTAESVEQQINKQPLRKQKKAAIHTNPSLF